MIEDSNKLKYYFYTFVLVFQRYPCYNGLRMQWLLRDIIQNNFVHFGDLMSWNEEADDRKLE